jgi:hypothetical protein
LTYIFTLFRLFNVISYIGIYQNGIFQLTIDSITDLQKHQEMLTFDKNYSLIIIEIRKRLPCTGLEPGIRKSLWQGVSPGAREKRIAPSAGCSALELPGTQRARSQDPSL